MGFIHRFNEESAAVTQSFGRLPDESIKLPSLRLGSASFSHKKGHKRSSSDVGFSRLKLRSKPDSSADSCPYMEIAAPTSRGQCSFF